MVSSPTTSRSMEIDGIKAIAIVGVVILHMSFKNQMAPATLDAIGCLQIIFGWSVIAFFLASGLVTRPVRNYSPLLQFAFSRFKRLLIPCLVFSWSNKLVLIALASFGLISRGDPHQLDLVNFILALVGPQFYFLPFLFLYRWGGAFLEMWLDETRLLLAAVACLLFANQFIPLPKFGYGGTFYLLPIYLFSYVAGKVMSPLRPDQAKVGQFTLIVIVGLSFKIFGSPIFLYPAVPIFLLIILRRYQDFARILSTTRLGRYSPSIYAWHAPVVLPLVNAIFRKTPSGTAIVIFSMLALTILLCILLGKATDVSGNFRRSLIYFER